LLEKILTRFRKANLYPKIGVEIEFYLPEQQNLDKIKNLVTNISADIQIVEEQGENQYEMIIPPSDDIINYITLVNILKNCLKTCGAVLNVIYTKESPPNALHLHINFVDSNGENKFLRAKNEYNPLVNHSLAGLCELMQESMLFLLPKEEDYLRFQLLPPVNVSWGANNRTTALRLPENVPQNFRIEYRVISPEADFEKAVLIILIGIYHGLKNKLTPSEKVHSLAHKIYHLSKLPTSLEEAKEYFIASSKLKSYLES
jgi:glutamine synthetase